MRTAGAALLMLLAVGCAGHGQPTGPSPVAGAEPKVVVVVVRDGVLLKAEHLEGAQQVEGTVEWVPTSVAYQSFELGRWWFSTADWEWVIVPQQGRLFWGIWRKEPASGDGVLGLIRFKGPPSLGGLRVWVDARAVAAVAEDRRNEPGGAADGPAPAIGVLRGAQGDGPGHRWFLEALGSGY